jgi:hypothetical protein
MKKLELVDADSTKFLALKAQGRGNKQCLKASRACPHQ